MQNNSYSETISWLFEQFPSYQQIGASAYKPDLGNIRELCGFLDHPEKKLKFIHIAGTNGKGSVSSMLGSILTESGQKTGLFTSPHLIDFRERIRINGEMIPESEVVNFCSRIRQHNWSIAPSFFEITFAMALWYFEKQEATICVIETGLGGRLDATNIIDPLVSVITNISLEHTQFLGNTLDAIAREKAGIIKKNRPVIIGESIEETAKVFSNIARQHSSRLIDCTTLPLSDQFEAPLLGNYQKRNLRTVLQTLDVLRSLQIETSDEAIRKGLNELSKNTGFMGRMQIISTSPLSILDVSHNEDGIVKTLETVRHLNKGKLHLIYGTSADKDYPKIVSLFPKDATVHFCTFRNQRTLSAEQFQQLNRQMHTQNPVYQDIKTAYKEVRSQSATDDTILIFGSFFLVADFF
jgi:dihydrofolate synthase/folylpolyglutamate synthase